MTADWHWHTFLEDGLFTYRNESDMLSLQSSTSRQRGNSRYSRDRLWGQLKGMREEGMCMSISGHERKFQVIISQLHCRHRIMAGCCERGHNVTHSRWREQWWPQRTTVLWMWAWSRVGMICFLGFSDRLDSCASTHHVSVKYEAVVREYVSWRLITL